MKKLMTMLAAAAMAFGLYADGALNDVWDASTKTTSDWNTPAQWTVPDGAADDAAVFTGDTAALGNKLTLKTGSAIVSRDIAGNPFANVSNVYFDVQLDLLGQALDELPTADQLNGAKLALFVLDNTELGATSPSTALYALGYNYSAPGNKALYELGGYDIKDLTNGVRRLTLNAYNNVLDASTAANGHAGFTLYLDGLDAAEEAGIPLNVSKVYWFKNDGTVDWEADKTGNTYLGTGVKPTVAVSNYYREKNLLLALIDGIEGQSFNDLGFAGNAAVTKATITETKPAFIGSDLVAMTYTYDKAKIEVTGPEIITEDQTVLTVKCIDTSITAPVFSTDNDNAVVDGNTITVTFVAGESFTISVSEAKATVTIGEDTFNFANIGDAIAKANDAEAAATIKLFDAVTIGDEDDFTFSGQDITLDLGGKTITITGAGKALANTAKLTVIDTVGGGIVDGPTENYGDMTINAGYFKGAIAAAKDSIDVSTAITAGKFDEAIDNGDDCDLTITGGQFSKDAYATADLVPVADGYEATDEGATTGYWLVREKAKTYALTIDDDIEGGEVTTDPEAGELAADTEVKVTATADTGYTLETITTNGQALAGDTFLMPAEAVEVSATFAAKAYKLNATAGENTTLTKDPEKTTYAYDETVVLTAALASGDYEWDQIPTGWTQGDNDTYTLTYTILDEDVESGNVVATPTAKTKAAPLPDPIKEGNDEQKEAYAKWAQDNNITGADPINAVAFALDVNVTLDIEEDVQDALDDVLKTEQEAADEVAKFSADYTPDYFDVEAYPNATFIFVETKEIEAENGRFFRLKAEFKPLP